MKILSIGAAVLIGAAVSIPMVTEAKSKSKKTTPVPATDITDKISAVHLASIIVSVHSPPASKEYKVAPATRITVNGRPAQLSGLATGMDVVVASAADGGTAATIDAKTAKH